MQSRALRPWLTALLLVPLSTGCESILGSGPGIELSVEADSLHLQRTLPRVVSIQVERTDFDGDVTLAAEGLPDGVTVVFDPAVLAPGGDQGEVTFTASAAAVLETTDVTIRASGDGLGDESVTMELTVIVRGSFGVDPLPDSLLIYQLESGLVKLAVRREGGFYQTIDYSVVEALPGVTISFDATSLVDTALVTIAPTADAPESTRTLQIHATTEGLPSRLTAIRLTVEQKPALGLLVPDTVEVERGRFHDAMVFLQRTNLDAAVDLTALDVASGVAVTFDPATIPGNESAASMRIDVSDSAAAGTSSFTVRGVGGDLSATATITLKVRNAP